MSETKPGTCFLCSKTIPHTPGTRMVITPERDGLQRVFHLNCFVAQTTGTRRDDIWTYRIVAAPTNTEASP